MLTVLVWLYLPTGEVAHSSRKKNCSLLASCQFLLLRNMKKMKKKRICASRVVLAPSARCRWKRKTTQKEFANRNRKAGKKKVSASRFMLAPSAKFEIKKKEPKIMVWERRGCFFCAWRIVLLVSWLRLGETESNSSLFCYRFFVNGRMKKMRTWTDK